MNPSGADAETLRRAIAALRAQRGVLGEAALAQALQPLQQRLDAWERGQAGVQRRQLSVLFIGVVEEDPGVIEIDDGAGVERLAAALEQARRSIETHGGRVLRFTGEGLKAGFGVDAAREDDALRAVRAGLAVLAAGGDAEPKLVLRAGVHTGLVALGAGLEDDHTAMGETVHMAARMAQSAPPGELRISHETWAHVRHRFVTEEPAPIALKGLDGPQRTHLVCSERARPTAADAADGAGAFVGRGAELARLAGHIADARAAAPPRLLAIVGDAGIGKSRLLREALACVADLPVLWARAQPDGQLRPWGLLRELLASHLGLTDGDPADAARARLVERLAPAFDAHGEAQAVLAGQLIGLDFDQHPALQGLDARARRDRGLAAFRAWLRSLAGSASPPVLVFEDLHWADAASLDALVQFGQSADGLRAALLATTRATLFERLPDAADGIERLDLQPLDPGEREALAHALLPGLDEWPEPLRRTVVEQADGNPYYMGELVRRLQDDGAVVRGAEGWQVDDQRLQRARLPSTLVGLLQARLDALPPPERGSAQLASIVGAVFWDAVLETLDETAPRELPGLQRHAVVRAQPASAFAGAVEWRFDHHLLHQVTYDTVRLADRRAGHAAVARWLMQRVADRGPEFLVITAQHAERGGDSGMAVDCFDRAAQQAEARFANALAIDCLRRALRLLPAHDARRLGLLQRLNQLCDLVGDRAGQRTALDDVESLLAAHPDPQAEASLCYDRALLADRLGELGHAADQAAQAVTLAEACANARVAALAHAELCWLACVRSDDATATRHVQAGLAWAQRAREDHPGVELMLLLMTAIVDKRFDRYGAAQDTLQRVCELAEARGERRTLLGALNHLCSLDSHCGRWASMAATARRTAGLAVEMGAMAAFTSAHAMQAWAALGAGDLPAAVRLGITAVELAGRHGLPHVQADANIVLGLARKRQGAASGARVAFEQAVAIFQGTGLAPQALAARVLLAEVDLMEGCLDAARAVVDDLLGEAGGGLAADELARRLEPLASTDEHFECLWACSCVLDAAGDARAAMVRAHARRQIEDWAARVSGPHADAAERQSLIDAVPIYRTIMAACRGAAVEGAPG